MWRGKSGTEPVDETAKGPVTWVTQSNGVLNKKVCAQRPAQGLGQTEGAGRGQWPLPGLCPAGTPGPLISLQLRGCDGPWTSRHVEIFCRGTPVARRSC